MNMPLAILNRRRRGFTAFSPATLFALAEPGVWYDPSDLTTLFQDPAGTTPVTAPSQSVGLMLDKSRGLALGTELVTNGAFGTNTNDWTAVNATLSVDTQRLKVLANAAYGWAYQAIPTVVGKTYKISFDITNGDSTGVYIFVGTDAGLTAANYDSGAKANGSHFAVFTATATTTYFKPTVGGTGKYAFFDNISVRELAGNHATQATAAARPTYSIEPVGGRRNLLTFSEQFDNAAWAKTNATVTANSVVAPDGTTTADKLVESATSGYHIASQFIGSVVATSVTFTVYAKAAERSWLLLSAYVGSDAICYFDLATPAVGTMGAGCTGTITAVGSDGWYRCSVTRTVTAGTYGLGHIVGPTTGNNVGSYAGDITKGILIWGAQLELGSTATNYQRVTTQHDVTEAGVASVSYLYFDGADDAMVTSSVNFTSTNKMTAFAGYRAILKTGSAMMFELSSVNSNVGSFSLNQGPIAGTTGFGALMNTGSVVGAQTDPLTIPYTSVASLKLDSALVGTANEISLRMNGTATPLPNIIGSDSGTGNFGNYPFYIGARNGSQFHFAGHIYSLIARGAFTDAPTIASTETYVAGKTGIVI
jgi:hypothetical protein